VIARRQIDRSDASDRLRLLGEFSDWCSLQMQPPQARDVASLVRRYLWSIDAHDSADSGAAVAAFLSRLRRAGRALKGLHNARSAISSWFEFLRSRGTWSGPAGTNPALAVRLGKLPKRIPRRLDDAELPAILEAAESAGIWPEVVLALSTGLRLSDLARLQWPDVDEPRRRLTIRDPKNGEERCESLSLAALAALRAQREKLRALGYGGYQQVFPSRHTHPGGFTLRDRRRSKKSWLTLMKPLQKRFPSFTRNTPGTGRAWHKFRHTFASRLAEANVTDRRIARLLGQKDVRSVDVYAHLRSDAYDPAVELAAPPIGKATGNGQRATGEEETAGPDFQI
jgi:integrase